MTTPERITKTPTDNDYEWVRHLLAWERNMTLNTGRMAVLHSTIVEVPGGWFRAMWRSFPTTEHSQAIDSHANDEVTEGRAAVEGIIYASHSHLVSVSLFGQAQRVPQERVEEANMMIDAVRASRGYRDVGDRPEVPYEMYINRFTIPVPVYEQTPSGLVHVAEDHAVLDMARLRGFRTL